MHFGIRPCPRRLYYYALLHNFRLSYRRNFRVAIRYVFITLYFRVRDMPIFLSLLMPD